MIQYRLAEMEDIPAIAALRGADEGGGAAEGRMRGYLAGVYHPGYALEPRVFWAAFEQESPVGYAAGHLTTRFECDGELQWIYVATEYRKQGLALELLRRVGEWFVNRGARRICVDPGEEAARSYYRRRGAVALNRHWMVWEDASALR